MPPTLADRLIHILSAIDAVQNMLANKTLEDFSNDLLLRLEVERALCLRSHHAIFHLLRRSQNALFASRNELV